MNRQDLEVIAAVNFEWDTSRGAYMAKDTGFGKPVELCAHGLDVAFSMLAPEDRFRPDSTISEDVESFQIQLFRQHEFESAYPNWPTGGACRLMMDRERLTYITPSKAVRGDYSYVAMADDTTAFLESDCGLIAGVKYVAQLHNVVRKANTAGTKRYQVTLDVWMHGEDVKDCAFVAASLSEAIDNALEAHLDDHVSDRYSNGEWSVKVLGSSYATSIVKE